MKLYAIKTVRPEGSEYYLTGVPFRDRDTGRYAPTRPDSLAIGVLAVARRFNTPGDASAWMQTNRVNVDLCAVVPVPPAAMREAEAAARAEWIGAGGKVQMGEVGL